MSKTGIVGFIVVFVFVLVGCGQMVREMPSQQALPPIDSPSPGQTQEVVIARSAVSLSLDAGLNKNTAGLIYKASANGVSDISINIQALTTFVVTHSASVVVSSNSDVSVDGLIGLKLVYNDVAQLDRLYVRVRLQDGTGLVGEQTPAAVIPLEVTPVESLAFTPLGLDPLPVKAWIGPFRQAVAEDFQFKYRGYLQKAIAQKYHGTLVFELVGITKHIQYQPSCVSPSGYKIAYVNGATLNVLDLRDGAVSRFFDHEDFFWEMTLKFYDENTLLYSGQNKLKRISIQTGKIDVVRTASPNCHVLFLQKDQSGNIYYTYHYPQLWPDYYMNCDVHKLNLDNTSQDTTLATGLVGSQEQGLASDLRSMYIYNRDSVATLAKFDLVTQIMETIYNPTGIIMNHDFPDYDNSYITGLNISNQGKKLVAKQYAAGVFLFDKERAVTEWIFPESHGLNVLGFSPPNDDTIYLHLKQVSAMGNLHDAERIYKYRPSDQTCVNLTEPSLSIWHDAVYGSGVYHIAIVIANSPYQQLYADVSITRRYPGVLSGIGATHELINLKPAEQGYSYINREYKVVPLADSSWNYTINITLKDSQMNVLKTYENNLNPDPSYVSQRDHVQTTTEKTYAFRVSQEQLVDLLKPGELKRFIAHELVGK